MRIMFLNPLPDCDMTSSLDLVQKEHCFGNASVDKPRKYKYKARPISDGGVLFLVLPTYEIGHLRAIGLSLS
ncbi:MAG: hypothetical protein M3M88_00950 [Thermoproteota archaeon]|nr:hypothetical protein [Thermoproteota archaeon]